MAIENREPLRSFDDLMMHRAIDLALRGRYTAPPNPWVGCVIVDTARRVVGEGYHRASGEPHAEVNALQQAGPYAAGATAYVTLEPCSHRGRTPPCVDALIGAGIARVVVALQDPDPRVQGRGLAALAARGLAVECGTCSQDATESLHSYLFQRTRNMPFTIAKAAMSLDGNIAAGDGSSQWLTGPQARLDVQHLRASCQAILVGAGTASRDLPRLTVRLPEIKLERPPMRVFLDATGRVPPVGPLFERHLAPTAALTTDRCPPSVRSAWAACGVEVVTLPTSESGHVSLEQALRWLAQRGVLQVLVEGGGMLLSAASEQSLIQRLVLYVSGYQLGRNGKPLFGSPIDGPLAGAPTWELLDIARFENDVRLTYAPGPFS